MTSSGIGGLGPSANTNVMADSDGISSINEQALWLHHHLDETDPAV
jgi:hypothetical protein